MRSSERSKPRSLFPQAHSISRGEPPNPGFLDGLILYFQKGKLRNREESHTFVEVVALEIEWSSVGSGKDNL